MAGPPITSTRVVMVKVPRLLSSGWENIFLGDTQVIHGVSRPRMCVYIYINIYIHKYYEREKGTQLHFPTRLFRESLHSSEV